MQSKELFQSTFRFLDFCSRRIRRNCTHLLLKKIALATIKAHNKNKMDIKYYFDKWVKYVEFRKYDQWCEIHNEELLEQEYSEKSNMDSVYWCWNCKYSDCEIH